MTTMTRVSAVEAQVRASQETGARCDLTDLYIRSGKIGKTDLNNGCYMWGEMLSIVAAELWRRGEADAARVTVKAGRFTVRQFLRQRFGIVTGAREYWQRANWTPDRADLQEFLSALRMQVDD